MFLELINEIVSSGLFFDEIMHGVVAIPVATLLWWKTKSLRQIIIMYLFLYFIDLDHLIDYWLYLGLKLNPPEFFQLDFFREKGTALIFAHAWEWVLILYFVFRKKGWKSFVAPVMLAILVHILWDGYRIGNYLFYSITYRLFTGFALP